MPSKFYSRQCIIGHQGYANQCAKNRSTKINKTLSLPSEISEPKAQNRDGMLLIPSITPFVEFILYETH